MGVRQIGQRLSVEATAAARDEGVAAGAEEAVVLADRQRALLAQLGDVEAAGLSFEADGSPSDATFGLALLLTATASEELRHATVKELVENATGAGQSSSHVARARLALHTVASEALEELQRSTLDPSNASEDEGFEAEARRFCQTRVDLLASARRQMA